MLWFDGTSFCPIDVLAVAIALPLWSKPGTRVTVLGVTVLKVTVPVGEVPLLGSVADSTTAVTPMLAVPAPVSVSAALMIVDVAALVTVTVLAPVEQEVKLASPP